jgi:hypothetical protein
MNESLYIALKEEAAEIQSFLEIIMSDDPNEADERGKQLQVYMARTGKMLADARQIYLEKKKGDIMNILRETARNSKATGTAINELVKSVCADEESLVTWIDRLNRSCTHQLDFCRTLMANYRAEMNMNTWGGGGRQSQPQY